jgi:ankyrin repeat protein
MVDNALTRSEARYYNHGCLFNGLGNLNINQRDPMGQMPLYIAAAEGYSIVVRLLVDKGAGVNA